MRFFVYLELLRQAAAPRDLVNAGGARVNLYVWYDNEAGYSCQVLRLVQRMAGVEHPRFPEAGAAGDDGSYNYICCCEEGHWADPPASVPLATCAAADAVDADEPLVRCSPRGQANIVRASALLMSPGEVVSLGRAL